jgi:hypothetical protein
MEHDPRGREECVGSRNDGIVMVADPTRVAVRIVVAGMAPLRRTRATIADAVAKARLTKPFSMDGRVLGPTNTFAAAMSTL